MSCTGLRHLTFISSQSVSDIDDDRYNKARLLFDILDTNFKRFVSANNFSVYESMIPYYNRHGTSSLLEESPYNLGVNFGVYARQMGIFFMRNHTVEKMPICQKQD